jgi:rhodanese-related sulfurtransferase
MSNVQPISAKELDDLLKSSSEVALLDVRQADERQYASINSPQAALDLFIPLGELQERVAEVESAIPANAFLVVYCHHGVRSQAAANWLSNRGASNVLNLTGGIDAWSIIVDKNVPRY